MSNTFEEYNTYLSNLQNEYHTCPDAINYVLATWLESYKERFVACWTNMYLHSNNVNSNRGESAHVRLKRLQTSQENFKNCWRIIHSPLELQHTEIKVSFEKSLTIVHRNYILPEFRELHGLISIHAMKLIMN